MRDQLLAVVRAWLERIAAANEPALALEPGALDDAQRLAEYLRDSDGDLEACYVLGWFHWFRHVALPKGPDRDASKETSRALFTPCFIAGVEELPEPLLPVLPGSAAGMAAMVIQQAKNSNDLILITKAVSLGQQALTVVPADHPDRAAMLSNLGAALGLRFWRAGEPTDLEEAITVSRAAVQAAPADHPGHAQCLANLGAVLRTRFERTGEPADLDEAIAIEREAIKATPADHPDRVIMLAILVTALRDRFGRVGKLTDLDEAITLAREAAQTAPADHPDREGMLTNLGGALRTRFERVGEPTDLDEAITINRRAVQVVPADHPDRATVLSNLSLALQTRFRRVAELTDLDEAISVSREAVQATPSDRPDRAKSLSNLSIALLARFNQVSEPADLDEAIRLSRTAMLTVPADHRDRAKSLSNLSRALLTRFKKVRKLADLGEAIRLSRTAVQTVPADHPDRAVILSNLSRAVRTRFEQLGALTDLDEAITIQREAVHATPADHPDRAGLLADLADALRVRFERVGAQTDLDEAISVSRDAVHATPADHPGRADTLSSLGVVLGLRFERGGELADLDEAISVGRDAVHATPADHPTRVTCLSSLGTNLRGRFEWVGVLADLDEALSVSRDAVRAIPAQDPNRALYLSNLGVALRLRFGRVGVLTDLDEAVSVSRDAVHATPAHHPDRADRLSNLGVALSIRFGRTGLRADLDEAVALGREAVQALPADRPDRVTYLSNLGAALGTRFARAGELADLDDAITVVREAVHTIPADHPHRAGMLSGLGYALWLRFGRMQAQADLDEALTRYAQAADVVSGAPSTRIHAARSAASLAAPSDSRHAARLLETAVRLLPGTASRRLERGDQQYALGGFAGLGCDAAALALADEAGISGEPAAQALRLVELGRGIMLSQALDTRNDLSDLQAHHPAIAERFIALRDQFDHVSDTLALIGDADPAVGPQQRRVADRHQLTAAFESTVTEIRGLDGFETFLLPPEPDQLIRHAQYGPIVVVNVSRYRSDAILLRSEGITSIPLPDLAQSAVIGRIDAVRQALNTACDPDVSADHWEDAQHALSSVLEWLWDSAAQPILDELGYQHTPTPGTGWPRVWWVPGGLLGFLPLHAAGYHREPPGPNGERRAVMDRVVSSYTPTVRALGYARERNTASGTDGRALIVAMPTTPGIDSPLRHATDEAELVHRRLPGSTLLIESPVPTDVHLPTRATVLAHLGRCGIAHFACHGSSDPADPSQNLLLLHDHETDPLTVASLGPIRLDQARLAYLSACRTAFNPSTVLIDEAIHLTTAFQLAGYPHVVGTLWEIDDELAVRIADSFYAALATAPNMIDVRGAAEALHHAVRGIRDELPTTPSQWAAYLHAGA